MCEVAASWLRNENTVCHIRHKARGANFLSYRATAEEHDSVNDIRFGSGARAMVSQSL